MIEYQLTGNEYIVVRTADNHHFSAETDAEAWSEYQDWLESGGEPEPFIESAPPALAFDHENRIRSLEGQPPLTMNEFKARMSTME